MTRYAATRTDGTCTSGLAAGTPEEVYRLITADPRAAGALRSLTCEQADDLTWPDASECPTE